MFNLEKILVDIQHNKLEKLDFSNMEKVSYSDNKSQTIFEHKTTIFSIIKISDDSFASASYDGSIFLWNLKTNNSFREINAYRESRAFTTLVFLPDNFFVCGYIKENNSGYIEILSMDGSIHRIFESWGLPINALKNNRLICVDNDENNHRVLVCSPHEERIMVELKEDKSVRTVTVFNNDKLLASLIGNIAENKVVKVWDIETSQCINRIEIDDRDPWLQGGMTVSSDGRFIVMGDSGSWGRDSNPIKIWSIETGNCVVMLSNGNKKTTQMSLLADGQLACASEEGILLWDLIASESITTLKGMHKESPISFFSMPNGQLISGGKDSQIVVWTFSTLRLQMNDIKFLLDAIHENTSITELNFSGMKLEDEDIDIMIELIKQVSNISLINMSNTGISAKAVNDLIELITDREKELKIIDSNGEKKIYQPVSLEAICADAMFQIYEGDYQGALDIFNKVIEKQPRSVIAFLGKGYAFDGLERLDESLVCWEEMLKIEFSNVAALVGKGRSLLYLRRYEDARQLLSQAEGLITNHSFSDDFDHMSMSCYIYLYLGMTYYFIKSWTLALEKFYEVLKILPHHVLALNGITNILLQIGKNDEALRFFNKVVELERKDIKLNIWEQHTLARFCLLDATYLNPVIAGAEAHKESRGNHLNPEAKARIESILNELTSILDLSMRSVDKKIHFEDEKIEKFYQRLVYEFRSVYRTAELIAQGEGRLVRSKTEIAYNFFIGISSFISVPGLTFAVNAVGQTILLAEEHLQKEGMLAFWEFLDGESDSIFVEAAYEIALRYQRQIKQLTNSGIFSLARCAALRMRKFVIKSIYSESTDVVDKKELLLNGVVERDFYRIKKTSIETIFSSKGFFNGWTAEGLFEESAFELVDISSLLNGENGDGQLFMNKKITTYQKDGDKFILKYGFRYATQDEKSKWDSSDVIEVTQEQSNHNLVAAVRPVSFKNQSNTLFSWGYRSSRESSAGDINTQIK